MIKDDEKSMKAKVRIYSIATFIFIAFELFCLDSVGGSKEIIYSCLFFGLFNVVSTIKYEYNEKKVDFIAALNSVSSIAILYLLIYSIVPTINKNILITIITIIIWLINFLILKKEYEDKEYLIKSFINNSIVCFISSFLFLFLMKYDDYSFVMLLILGFAYASFYIASKSKSENESLGGVFLFFPALIYAGVSNEKIGIIYILLVLFCAPTLDVIAYRIVNPEGDENRISILIPLLLFSFISSYFVAYSSTHEVLSFYYGVLFLIIPIILVCYTVRNCDYYRPSFSIWFFSLILSIVFIISIYLIIKYSPYVFISARELENFVMNDAYRLLSSYSTVITVGFLVYLPILVVILNRFGFKRN